MTAAEAGQPDGGSGKPPGHAKPDPSDDDDNSGPTTDSGHVLPDAVKSSVFSVNSAIEKLDAFIADAQQRFDKETDTIHGIQNQMQTLLDNALKEIAATFDETGMRKQAEREMQLDVLKPTVVTAVALAFLDFVGGPVIIKVAPSTYPYSLEGLVFVAAAVGIVAVLNRIQKGFRRLGGLKEERLAKLTQENSTITEGMRSMTNDMRTNQASHEQFTRTIMKGVESRLDTLKEMIGPLILGHVADRDFATRRKLHETAASELGKNLFRSGSKKKNVDSDE